MNYSPDGLAESLKRYQDFTNFEKIKLQIYESDPVPIDIQIEVCHTFIIIQGIKQLIAILRKEEVMSNMDSSMKPSAVASLLKK
jgi:hypothetical protein